MRWYFSDTLRSNACLWLTVLNYLYGNFGETIHLKEPISMAVRRYGWFRSEWLVHPFSRSNTHRVSHSNLPSLVRFSIHCSFSDREMRRRWREKRAVTRPDDASRRHPHTLTVLFIQKEVDHLKEYYSCNLKGGAEPAAQRLEFHS